VHVGWGHRRNHPCQVSSQSVQQFRLPRGSKITISHRLGEWFLQQCYTLTCYTVIVEKSCFDSHITNKNHFFCISKVVQQDFYVSGHIYSFSVSRFFSTLYTKKILKSVDFLNRVIQK